MTLRVLVADDHEPIRKGVRDALETAGMSICAEVANAQDAVAAAQEQQPDVCLIDIEMPGQGLRAVGRIVDSVPDTKVMVLTVSDANDDLLDALRAGAIGYLLKDIRAEGLVEAVQAAAEGHVVLANDLQAKLVTQFRKNVTSRSLKNAAGGTVELTPREWDVMELLSKDLSTAEIGKRLFLRPGTVRRHVAEVVHKLRVRNRDDAVVMFRRQVRPSRRRPPG